MAHNSAEAPQFVFFTNNSGAVVVNLNELVFGKNVKNGSALHFRDASELLVTETAEDVQEILQRIFGNRPEFRANENTGNPRPVERNVDRNVERSNSERNPVDRNIDRNTGERYDNPREPRSRGRKFQRNTEAFSEDGFADDF
jgi:hypothetical protein